MKVVEADGFNFCFTDAIEAFIFDGKDHGAPMKRVDIIAEFESAYIYVEIKDYEDYSLQDTSSNLKEDDNSCQQKHFKWLKEYLKYKFRDSHLYRYAERKVDKPVYYICLICRENPLNSRLQKSLKQELPVGKASPRWVDPLAKACHVVNLEEWNKNFPNWPVTRLNQSTERREN